MEKLIVLKLDGDFNQGFRVTLEIGLEGDRREVEIIGNLPPATYLIQEYGDWQSIYRSLGKRYRIIKVRETRSDVSLKKKIQECRTQAFKLRDWQSIYRSLGKRYRIIKVRETRSDVSLKEKIQECRTQAFKLRDRLNSWLKADSFLSIREKWLEKVSTSDDVRVMIRADNHQLWQLPWQQWDLLELYSFAEIELSSLEYERPPKVQQPSQKDQLKILAIFGNSEGIKLEEDRKRLENLPNAATTFLVEPQRQELNDQLWQQAWDILFFAGHSQTEGERGRIYLNQTDSLTLDELKYALQKAVDGGLQLAIFNSCDGLGLARDLAQLHIPQLIVMREPVADQVAQKFLQYFLDSFASGKPLYRAVQEARQRLQGLEKDFPCASWLPVICQNPAAVPLKWPELSKPAIEPLSEPDTTPILPLWPRLRTLCVTSLVVTSIVMGGRSLGIMQRWELKAYDHLLRQRPSETADSRILLVGANEEDLRKYKHPLSDAVLAQLIAKLQQYRPLAMGLDIFRDQPVPPSDQSFVTQLQQNQHLFTVCFGTEPKYAVAPPPKSPAEQLGFNDLENDEAR